VANDKRAQARQLWEQSGGTLPLKDIAQQLGVSEATVRTWKRRDKWGETDETQRAFRKYETQRDTNRKRQAAVNTSLARVIDQAEALSEVEKEFCLHYVQCYNAAQAAWRTGRYSTYASAKQAGYMMLHKPAVQAEIKRLKAIKRAGILADGDDLIELHMRIAFADIGDYAVWAYKDGSNHMAVYQSVDVDTQLIKEVSETARGFKLKMQDQAKSRDFLAQYFLLNPTDKHKIEYDRKKLEFEQQKVAAEVKTMAAGDAPYLPDAVWRELMNPAYAEHLTATQPTQIFFGGSSSGKSFGILGQRTVRDVLKGDRNYLICRKTGRTLRNSSFNEIKKCISRMDLEPYFSINKTDMVITCRPTGCQILFAGLDDVEKIKSITPAQGVLTDVVIEEATEADYDDYKQLNKRLRGGDESTVKRVTLLFNPILQDHWIFENFFAGTWDDSKDQYISKDLLIRRTTYKDNRWLTADDIAKLEGETDKYYYEVYTLGRWGVLGNLIFTNWEIRDLTEVAKATHQFYNGLDFGFFPDPAAFVRMGYNRAKKEVYIFTERGGTHMTNDVLAEEIKPIIRRELVTCDSAEPKSIQELNNFGITAVGAVKGSGSLEFGIKWLQRQKIIVDPSCRETILELKKYKYREDRNGKVLPEPVDRDCHYIDACRYALERIMVEVRIS
jgi:phage terminase large subunit